MSREVIPEWYTVAEVAKILNVSNDTVQRQFENVAGVIDLGSAETMHKRRKRSLRISRKAIDTFINSKQVTNAGLRRSPNILK